jgi:hypothetical protein
MQDKQSLKTVNIYRTKIVEYVNQYLACWSQKVLDVQSDSKKGCK